MKDSSSKTMVRTESQLFDPPMPIVIIGTESNEQVDFMTASWFTRLELNPYLIGVSVQKQHYTHQSIIENKCFSINVPTVDLVDRVDTVGYFSGKEYDKSEAFDIFYGDNKKSPMIEGSIVSFECELVDTLDITTRDNQHPFAHSLFVASVKTVWVHKGEAIKSINYEKYKPLLATFSPMRYWTIGKNIGKLHDKDHFFDIHKKGE